MNDSLFILIMWKQNAEYETHKTCSEKVDFENKRREDACCGEARGNAVALKFG